MRSNCGFDKLGEIRFEWKVEIENCTDTFPSLSNKQLTNYYTTSSLCFCRNLLFLMQPPFLSLNPIQIEDTRIHN